MMTNKSLRGKSPTTWRLMISNWFIPSVSDLISLDKNFREFKMITGNFFSAADLGAVFISDACDLRLDRGVKKSSREVLDVLHSRADSFLFEHRAEPAVSGWVAENQLAVQNHGLHRIRQHFDLVLLAECHQLWHLDDIQVKEICCEKFSNNFKRFVCSGGIKSRGGDHKKFLYFCLYAFGVPFLLTFITLAADNSNFISPSYRPLMGLTSCWINKSRVIQGIYLYSPISIIIAANFSLFSATAWKIYRIYKETSIIRDSESGRHSKIDIDKTRWNIFI